MVRFKQLVKNFYVEIIRFFTVEVIPPSAPSNEPKKEREKTSPFVVLLTRSAALSAAQ
jgi:hypothetical protein